MPRRDSDASTGRTTPLDGIPGDTTKEIAVGCYAIMRGKSIGRIVDKRTRNGGIWWLIKFPNGSLMLAQRTHLTPL